METPGTGLLSLWATRSTAAIISNGYGDGQSNPVPGSTLVGGVLLWVLWNPVVPEVFGVKSID